jgi:murein DD-endopeptidase MepM/ murein hydrolase activator NlpD
MFEGIATFINKVLALITSITNAANFAANPVGSTIEQIRGQNAPSNEEKSNEGSKTLPTQNETPQVPETPATKGKRSLITIPEHINARFNDTGSVAWKNQPGGKHLGTDFGAPNGSAVYAPYNVRIIKVGSYSDTGRLGSYIIGKLDDDTEFYSGHLSGVMVKPQDYVRAGTRIGSIGYYNHTHIQLRVNGGLYDFERYAKDHP